MTRLAATLALVITLAAACSPRPVPPPAAAQPLRVRADASAYPLFAGLQDAWQQTGQATPLEVREVNSTLALRDLQAGKADCIATCWKPAPGTPLPPGVEANWRWTPLVYDALVIVAHPRNPVASLTMPQLRDLFAGRIETWLELGGDPDETLVVSREDGAGTHWDFEAQVMNGLQVTPAAVVMPSGRAVVEFVAGQPGAVGYASLSQLGPQVKALALEGVAPSLETVQSGTYPLPGLCYLVMPEKATAQAEALARFATSAAGQEALAGILQAATPGNR